MATTQAADRYDAIVIGTGQAGIPLALSLAQAGRKTAIVERDHVGGNCVKVGCTPTKTMVDSCLVAYLARRAGDYGVR
ncbi:MAG: FAD-dependent oxidoreductase, partial [candidate division NC10 bacterium]|nr:FAD-dependent oxidoreductase [candidate division NC10 bacterium]